MRSTLRDQKGFSMVELCLVIVVLAIMAVAATPSRMPLQLESAARQVATDIRTAQTLAMTTSQAHGFKTNNNTQYQVYRQAPGTYAVNPQTNGNFLINLPVRFRGVTFGGNYQIQFDAQGKPTQGAGSIIMQESGQTKTIVVTQNTGAVTVQ